ncbi:MAG TPA: vanomycin resistance protein VanB [Selenomonas sp.]|nr:vanomycin resistance protein VanB [Selenomonas sp.]
MSTSITRKSIIIVFITFTCLLTLTVMGVSLYVSSSNRIAYGVIAENCRLDGMTKQDAEKFFEEAGRLKLAHKSIHLTYGSQDWYISPDEIGMTANASNAAEAAYAIGRSELNPIRNLIVRYECAKEGHYIEMDASYDESLLMAKLDAIAAELHQDPVNAYCLLNSDGSITKIAGISGRTLDGKALADTLAPALKKFDFTSVELSPSEQPPSVRTEDIVNINSILASYSTSFYPGDRGRNIELAAEKLDGVLVRSGSNFSFNDVVGERTASAGYREAGVIIDGRLEDGIGGGVCQVSSTLYNAVLLAGLDSTERTAHFSPSSYCPAGRDATVSYGLLDFQFYNPLPNNVYLVSETSGTELTIYVLGNWGDLNGNTITLETEGNRMSPSVYRVYTRNGNVVEREFLHTDDYS